MCRALRTWNWMTLQHMDARVWHGDGTQEARVPIVTPSLQLPIPYSICSQPDLRSSWRMQGQGYPVCSSEIIQVPALTSLHLNPSSNCSFPVWQAGTGSANFSCQGTMLWLERAMHDHTYCSINYFFLNCPEILERKQASVLTEELSMNSHFSHGAN